MRDLISDIQQDIQLGVLSFREIAEKHNVPFAWVNEAWDMLCEEEDQAKRYAHDSLERDYGEPYEPDYGDSWYEDQYDLGDY